MRKVFFLLFFLANLALASAFPLLSYKPFGEPLYDAKSRFLFTGKERDSESGLYYYGARYYDAWKGQFIQPDSILQNPYNPQALNRYSYVQNNPYKFKDDSGNSPTLVTGAIGFVAGGLLGGAFSLGGQLWNNGGNINKVSWSDVGKGATVGAVAGGIAGLTGGASLLASVGGGVVAGRAAQVTENALNDRPLGENVANVGDIGFDVLTAGVAHGAGKYISQSGKGIVKSESEQVLDDLGIGRYDYMPLSTQKGEFKLTKHALLDMTDPSRSISTKQIANTINNNQGVSRIYQGSAQTAFIDRQSKLFVPTTGTGSIPTVYYAREGYLDRILNQYRKK
jgi:RHS repeat-associated protein